jgi:tryprostatin B 6-hydroxylase
MEVINFYRTHDEALLCVVGFLSGILIHNTIFVRREWHIQAPQIFLQLFFLYIACPVLANILHDTLVGRILSRVVSWTYGYLPGLVASILVYRTVLHPLTRAGFPGPWYAKVSKIWHVWACRTSKNHLVLDTLHQKYGTFVRTGMDH